MTNPSAGTLTIERKQSHVELCLHANVAFSGKTTGFERFYFEHNALPEIAFAEIDCSTTFLGRHIGAPLMVSSMTGGYSEASTLNRQLAEAAEHFQIPLGVGSMRQTLESPLHRESFAVTRKYAPTTLLFANIGAPEVAQGLSQSDVAMMLDLLRADGLIVHLNAAQELFQPEGNTNFHRVLEEIHNLCATTNVPIIVKEVGNGIGAAVAEQLMEAGVQALDVAGAGGISWQKVEEYRFLQQFGHEHRFSSNALDELLNWGIPTTNCLLDIAELKRLQPQFQQIEIIASGGVSSGMDVAKSLAMGAQLAASARHLLHALHAGTLTATIEQWLNDLKAAMFLTGAATVDALRTKSLLNH
uniref:Isopentenyl-diphosphate delta-isomerase n=1 Tax=Chlorobium chlorochromatii (strain CaD3) TaxID=340177 RepID=IDI2_CHLCH|nr:RecName: Full=Isopentenyl-diphosphate delta-isomerase; Short=IPP isomerase; AltName: Full=Isopentenyl diphosphate:dimethylallyl diphosphate isomerase; AltName: Full=Isopentenyl pyrophosphate isomerase; AltName: Full=Type 2 isopentenyl diphosphate isomerase; Short=IDI-2 [Chlorobium chlorochromatii CaD3]